MSLSSGMQGYLESLYWLGEAGIDRTPTNLSRAMKVSPPSVTEMVNRLVKEGMVRRGPGKRIALTDHGEEVAKHVVKRHRLVEAFLVKVMGVPWDEVHEEAEAFEMRVTPKLEARMLEIIGEPAKEARLTDDGGRSATLPLYAARTISVAVQRSGDGEPVEFDQESLATAYLLGESHWSR